MKALALCLVGSLFALAGCTTSTDAQVETPDVDTDTHLACTLPCTGPHYEVRLGTVVNQTLRLTSQVTPIVHDAVRAKLDADSQIDVDEGWWDQTTTPLALEIVPVLSSIIYQDGNLSVTVQLQVYRYSSMGLLGVVQQKVTMPGVAPTNSVDENLLMANAAQHATERFITDLPAYY